MMQPNDTKAEGRNKIGPGTMAVGLFWLAGVIAALAAIVVYSNSPGKAEAAPVQRPLESQITRGVWSALSGPSRGED